MRRASVGARRAPGAPGTRRSPARSRPPRRGRPAARPPRSAYTGTATAQPRCTATAAVAAPPSPIPAVPPMTPSSTASVRNCMATWIRRAPIARRSPISTRRSSTPITRMFAMPMPPPKTPSARSSPKRADMAVLRPPEPRRFLGDLYAAASTAERVRAAPRPRPRQGGGGGEYPKLQHPVQRPPEPEASLSLGGVPFALSLTKRRLLDPRCGGLEVGGYRSEP
jgi:hypothetical protein